MLRLPVLLLCFIYIFFPLPAQAAPGYLNNNNLLMLPLRQTFEALGYTVRWQDGTTGLQRGSQTVMLFDGEEYYLAGEQLQPLRVLPRKVNGSIYISECFLQEVASLRSQSREIGSSSYKLVYSTEPQTDGSAVSFSVQGVLFDPYEYAREAVLDVPILMYHMIDDPARYSGIGHYEKYLVHPEQFRDQLRWLRDNGYEAVTLLDLHAHRVNGKPLREKPVIITFDDGYACVYHNALPELLRYDMTGTVFVCSGWLTGDRHLSPEMLRTLHEKGLEIGSHSVTHANLLELTPPEAAWEIVQSRIELEAVLGSRPDFFSYPYGAFRAEIINLVRESGYLGAVTASGGENSCPQDLYRLGRIFIAYQDDLDSFAQKVQALTGADRTLTAE